MNKKILIVDDDLYIRELYEEIFKDAGFDVSTAFDGEEGFEKMQQGGYDIVLLDVMMPKLDGIGVLSKLQTTPPSVKNGPILLLTNLAHESVIQDALKKGAAGFLIKTDVTPDELVAKVNKYLEKLGA